MSDKENDKVYDEVTDWLCEQGYQWHDILQDKTGYYVADMPDEETVRKLYLPAQFQELKLI